ncbi:hypothetical protein B0H10DRAFT_2446996 [Mycena sp. CBHHK59/15]|nr:hypothetical protein B0H10DRAFT_2446996 [Mycena sp. CBHHK59/15]
MRYLAPNSSSQTKTALKRPRARSSTRFLEPIARPRAEAQTRPGALTDRAATLRPDDQPGRSSTASSRRQLRETAPDENARPRRARRSRPRRLVPSSQVLHPPVTHPPHPTHAPPSPPTPHARGGLCTPYAPLACRPPCPHPPAPDWPRLPPSASPPVCCPNRLRRASPSSATRRIPPRAADLPRLRTRARPRLACAVPLQRARLHVNPATPRMRPAAPNARAHTRRHLSPSALHAWPLYHFHRDDAAASQYLGAARARIISVRKPDDASTRVVPVYLPLLRAVRNRAGGARREVSSGGGVHARTSSRAAEARLHRTPRPTPAPPSTAAPARLCPGFQHAPPANRRRHAARTEAATKESRAPSPAPEFSRRIDYRPEFTGRGLQGGRGLRRWSSVGERRRYASANSGGFGDAAEVGSGRSQMRSGPT